MGRQRDEGNPTAKVGYTKRYGHHAQYKQNDLSPLEILDYVSIEHELRDVNQDEIDQITRDTLLDIGGGRVIPDDI